jgi:hypothetical protein
VDREKAIKRIARRQYYDLHGEVSVSQLEVQLAAKPDAELQRLLEETGPRSRATQLLKKSAQERRWPRGPRD